MDLNNPQNQGYWFVVREDQSNVIFSSNNFAIQNPQNQETRYHIIDTIDRQYIQLNEASVAVQEETVETTDNEFITQTKDSKDKDVFWDRSRVKLLMTLCLENITSIANTNREKSVWDEMAGLVGTTAEECKRKYRYLRRTYIRLLKKKRLGKEIKWIHYNMCEEIFKSQSLSPAVLDTWEDNRVRHLLTLYIANLDRLRNPSLVQKDVWQDIAAALATTEYNCYHKFKNLKRTYFSLLERSRKTGKIIKWQYQQYFERIFYNYNPECNPWDRDKIKSLLEAYSERIHKFRNPKYQKKELWKEIATILNESPHTCDRKFRNLKQTYMKLKFKGNGNKNNMRWRYYKDFEAIFSTQYHKNNTDIILGKLEEEDYIIQMLNFYIENRHKFRDPLTKNRTIWKSIASKLGLTPYECDKKFRNLKQSYIRISEKKGHNEKAVNWPYYNYFEKIYEDDPHVEQCRQDGVPLREIRRVVQDVQERRYNDKMFEKLVQVVEESNNIQKERNRILQALLDRK